MGECQRQRDGGEGRRTRPAPHPTLAPYPEQSYLRDVSSTEIPDHLQQALGTAYTIERELGGGGMSRVFLADEAALGRKVVVKVLRPELAGDLSAERFKREVRLAARLQHPHIVPLLAAGSLDSGLLYYTMPLVEGSTLRGRLEHEGALPIADVVRIVSDVASALAYAHRAGVAHRDIKPENILLSDGGAVVTDFGIAKAISAARTTLSDSDARSSATLTAAGTSLGTPAYMAPEQVAGDATDHRADLYAIGVIAYEMLCGHAPFEGRNAQQLMAAHATQSPEPLVKRRASVPPALAALVMRLLEKNPADRPQSADEVRQALDETAAPPRMLVPWTGERHVAVKRKPWWMVPWALLAATLVFAAMYRANVPRSDRAIVVSFTAPPGQELRPANNAAFSPDGTRLAFVATDAQGRSSIWVRSLDSTQAVRIDHTDGATWPTWSPDGLTLGFFADAQLKIIDLRGGAARSLCPSAFVVGATFTSDDVIVYAPSVFGSLYKASVKHGDCKPLTKLRLGDGDHRRPSALPDGRVLFSSVVTNTALAANLASGAIVEIRRPGRDAQFVAPDWMLYYDTDNGPLYAQRLDLATLKPRGEPQIVAEHVSTVNGRFARFAASPSALLFEQTSASATKLHWVDRQSLLRDSVLAPADAQSFAVSHDGRRIVFGGLGLSLYDRDRNVTTRLASQTVRNQLSSDPAWDPGDTLIAYRTSFEGTPTLNIINVATGKVDSLIALPRRIPFRPSWSPDGRHLAITFRPGDLGAYEELWIYSFATHTATRAFDPKGNLASPAWSPDGGWLAYESDESGASEVYVRPVTGQSAPIRVSNAGGQFPHWRGDGKSVYYRAPDGSIMEVAVTRGRSLGLSTPALAVARAPFSFSAANRAFAVTPNGEQYIAFARGDAPVFTLMLNWQARLHR